MAEISDSQQQTSTPLNKRFTVLQVGRGDADEEGPSPSSSSITTALPELLTRDINSLSCLQACFHTLQRGKEPFTLFIPWAWVTHSFYQLFNICCSTLNRHISRFYYFLQYQIHQVIDKLTNLLAFHGALLWFFVIKQKIVWILPFPSKWNTAIQQFNSAFTF